MTQKRNPDPLMAKAIQTRHASALPDFKNDNERAMPGPLSPKATIRLHTYIGHQLFFGRQTSEKPKYREQCFMSYASNLNALWSCAQADDPYADWKLIQIEEQITKVKEKVVDILETLQQLLDGLISAGIQPVSHYSIRPVDVPISFRTVQAAVSIQLLGQVDGVIQKALMSRHFGLVTDQDWQKVLAQSVSPLRHLFSLAQFRVGGATRDDFAANNARARAAIEKLGQPPADILEGLRRPQLGPKPGRSMVFTEETAPKPLDSVVEQALENLGQSDEALNTVVTDNS